MPKGAYRTELEWAEGQAWLVAREAPSGRVVKAIALDAEGLESPTFPEPASRPRPPQIPGIENWSQTPAGWLGHRLNTLLLFENKPAANP